MCEPLLGRIRLWDVGLANWRMESERGPVAFTIAWAFIADVFLVS